MKTTLLFSALLLALPTAALTQDAAPVRIVFDKGSARIDLMTARPLPVYTKAVQGSFRFHLLCLNEGDDFIYYMFDALRKVQVGELAYMEKDQPQFAIWNLVWKNGSGLHPKFGPRIHHLAVSFIPLSPSTEKPEERVYLRLNDLERIEWSEVKE